MSDNSPAIPPRKFKSPPPSPPREEDLTGAHQWSDDEAQHLDPTNFHRKGKAREFHEGDGDNEREEFQEYPPIGEQEAETRQIEENLKRWEVAERMKRKAARDSTLSTTSSSSLLSDVARRTSLLWSASKPHHRPRSSVSSSRGAHAALSTQDNPDTDGEFVPLDDVAETPAASPLMHDEHDPSNPFNDPASAPGDGIRNTADNYVHRPALLTASSSIRRPPTPKPLPIPEPRSPPPPVADMSQMGKGLPDQNPAEEKESRWWHEWLCGLSEGPDRGGDNQSGRTNPFE